MAHRVWARGEDSEGHAFSAASGWSIRGLGKRGSSCSCIGCGGSHGSGKQRIAGVCFGNRAVSIYQNTTISGRGHATGRSYVHPGSNGQSGGVQRACQHSSSSESSGIGAIRARIGTTIQRRASHVVSVCWLLRDSSLLKVSRVQRHPHCRASTVLSALWR